MQPCSESADYAITAWSVAQLPLKTSRGYDKGDEAGNVGVNFSSVFPSQNNVENIAGKVLQLEPKYQ